MDAPNRNPESQSRSNPRTTGHQRNAPDPARHRNTHARTQSSPQHSHPQQGSSLSSVPADPNSRTASSRPRTSRHAGQNTGSHYVRNADFNDVIQGENNRLSLPPPYAASPPDGHYTCANPNWPNDGSEGLENVDHYSRRNATSANNNGIRRPRTRESLRARPSIELHVGHGRSSLPSAAADRDFPTRVRQIGIGKSDKRKCQVYEEVAVPEPDDYLVKLREIQVRTANQLPSEPPSAAEDDQPFLTGIYMGQESEDYLIEVYRSWPTDKQLPMQFVDRWGTGIVYGKRVEDQPYVRKERPVRLDLYRYVSKSGGTSYRWIDSEALQTYILPPTNRAHGQEVSQFDYVKTIVFKNEVLGKLVDRTGSANFLTLFPRLKRAIVSLEECHFGPSPGFVSKLGFKSIDRNSYRALGAERAFSSLIDAVSRRNPMWLGPTLIIAVKDQDDFSENEVLRLEASAESVDDRVRDPNLTLHLRDERSAWAQARENSIRPARPQTMMDLRQQINRGHRTSAPVNQTQDPFGQRGDMDIIVEEGGRPAGHQYSQVNPDALNQLERGDMAGPTDSESGFRRLEPNNRPGLLERTRRASQRFMNLFRPARISSSSGPRPMSLQPRMPRSSTAPFLGRRSSGPVENNASQGFQQAAQPDQESPTRRRRMAASISNFGRRFSGEITGADAPAIDEEDTGHESEDSVTLREHSTLRPKRIELLRRGG